MTSMSNDSENDQGTRMSSELLQLQSINNRMNVSLMIDSTVKRSEMNDETSLKRSITALKELRNLYNDSTAQFKSEEQAEVVKIAMKKSEDVLIILSTRGGKSAMFMAPASAEKELTTVVIVPFVAL